MAYYCIYHVDLRTPVLKSATVFFVADNDQDAEEYYFNLVAKFKKRNDPNVPDYQMYRMDLYKTGWSDLEYLDFCQQSKFLYHPFCRFENCLQKPPKPWERMRSNVFAPDDWEDLQWASESIIPNQEIHKGAAI